MAYMAFVFPLAILALVGVSIVKLSLPLSSALTFLTILLPLLAAANTFLLPSLFKTNRASSSPTKPSDAAISIQNLLRSPSFLQALQLLQYLLTTVLAILYAQDLVPSATRDCTLATRWQHLFRTKDALAIRTIQDALECCGFRSVRDMAWPFPPAEANRQCAARFDRASACRAPWMEALQRSAGVNFGVVVAVGLLQVLSIILARHYSAAAGSRNSEGFSSWGDVFRRFTRRDNNRHGILASRPLLTSGQTQTEEADEEVGRDGHENGQYYGTTEHNHGQGPRIEPSGLQQEQNEWRE